MPRPKPEDISSAGQDSFLDVVTNIVGILIILVMLVGGRARQVIQNAMPVQSDRVAALEQEVDVLDQKVALAESEVEELAAQGRTVATAAAFAGEARLQLATAVSAATLEIDRRKQETDAVKVKAAEAAARRKELETEIEHCTLEAEGLAHLPATTKEVLAYPTPVGRTVNGEEIHFRLGEGRRSSAGIFARLRDRGEGGSVSRAGPDPVSRVGGAAGRYGQWRDHRGGSLTPVTVSAGALGSDARDDGDALVLSRQLRRLPHRPGRHASAGHSHGLSADAGGGPYRRLHGRQQVCRAVQPAAEIRLGK